MKKKIDRKKQIHMIATLGVFLFFAVVGIVTAVLYMCGVKNNIVKVIRLISLICSAVMFIIIMIVAVTTHPSY